MSDADKKPSPPPATSSPTPASAAKQPTGLPSPVKNPMISRRAFLAGALGVSTLLTVASIGSSGGILGPLVPSKEGPTVVASWNDPVSGLDTRYQIVKSTSGLYSPTNYSDFFYFPYPVSESPYYKNMIARLPDPLVNPYYSSDPVLSHVAAFNLTCVHLRCIVNPGYAGSTGSGEFRLQCPCHGSQYRLTDAVPVEGPAYDLGLLPLPRVKLAYDSTTGNITATDLDGQAGIGRTD